MDILPAPAPPCSPLPGNFSHTERWLVVRLGHLGDVLLTTGVLRYWGERLKLRFTVLTRQEWAPVFDNHPYVDAVITPKPEQLHVPALFPWLRQIAGAYAGWGLIDLHSNLRTRLLRLCWQGPVRVYPKFSVARRLFLASKGKFFGKQLRSASVTQRYALALEQVIPPKEQLLPELWLNKAERTQAADRLRAISPCHTAPIALHPYATHPCKTWPATHWQALVQALDMQKLPWISLGKGVPLFSGRPEEFTNACSLRESAALLSFCRVLVSGDSGPLHLASAVNTPVIGLFGPTTPEWGFYPAGPHDRVMERNLPCRPCSLHGGGICANQGECLAGIAPDQLLAELALFAPIPCKSLPPLV